MQHLLLDNLIYVYPASLNWCACPKAAKSLLHEANTDTAALAPAEQQKHPYVNERKSVGSTFCDNIQGAVCFVFNS